MIVTIASGKGGTGKTTVAVNLAVTASQKTADRSDSAFIAANENMLNSRAVIELFDCDVEEPNAHLFVKPQNITKKDVLTMIPEVDPTLCNLCGECEKICQFSAITIAAKKIMVFPEMCHSCKGCSMVCPNNAIKEGSRQLGYLLTGCADQNYVNNSMNQTFKVTWGELRVGEAMSPPLIKQVKKEISLKTDKISIVDAPPGTSCPAVTTLKDSDFALLVAEETPFGLNDLTLTVEALKKLNVPMGIVVNRSDSTQKGIIDQYADRENIEILQKIPFSREAAKVCAKGLFLVDEIPEMKLLFNELYIKIVDRVFKGKEELDQSKKESIKVVYENL